MIHNNKVLGKPLQLYIDTKLNIQDISEVFAGCEAYATDTHEYAIFNGLSWDFMIFGSVFDDMQVGLSNIKAPASDPPTWVAYRSCEVPAFGEGNTNTLYFTVQLPHSWKEGSSIEPHIHAVYPNANAGNSVWRFTYSWANIGATYPAETTITSTFSSPTTANAHVLHSFGAVSGSGKTASSVLLCSISRLGANAADTYNSNIYAVSADIHIEKNRLGAITI